MFHPPQNNLKLKSISSADLEVNTDRSGRHSRGYIQTLRCSWSVLKAINTTGIKVTWMSRCEGMFIKGQFLFTVEKEISLPRLQSAWIQRVTKERVWLCCVSVFYVRNAIDVLFFSYNDFGNITDSNDVLRRFKISKTYPKTDIEKNKGKQRIDQDNILHGWSIAFFTFSDAWLFYGMGRFSGS